MDCGKRPRSALLHLVGTVKKRLPHSTAFTIEGEARTNERARHGMKRVYTPVKTKIARREVVQAYRSAQLTDAVHAGPVRMKVTIEHAAAKGEAWPGRFCRKKPDLDNVLKLVADALNGVAYLDDAQIIEMRAEKGYALGSAVHVVLTFEEELPKPKDGLEKLGPSLWRLWNQGSHVGWVLRNTGKEGRYAVATRLGKQAPISAYCSGYGRTLAEAVAQLNGESAAHETI